MNRHEEIQKELKELSSRLADTEKQEGFTVPVNYFESLADKVLEQVKNETVAEPAPKPKQVSWFDQLAESIVSLFQPQFAVAFASLALLLVAGVYLYPKSTTTNTELALTVDEAEYYLAENLDDFDDELLLEIGLDEGDDLYLDSELESEYIEEYLNEIIDEIDDSTLDDLL